MASTSSSSTPSDAQLIKKWDAFISFRGKDIRHDSPWCLDELVKIDECSKTWGQTVLPVFYNVDPTHVQELEGSFGKKFHKLQEECKDCLDKVDAWRHALIEISNLAGWDSTSRNIKSEAKLVEEIVRNVWEKLSQMPLSVSCCDNLIGIDWRVTKVESLLQAASMKEEPTIGIWGMGGIGKTTIASEVYSQNIGKFDGCCFVNMKEDEIRKENPIVFQDKIICKLLGEKNLSMGIKDVPYFRALIRRRIRGNKFLIIFDDVDDPCLLKQAGVCGLFDMGSRIIITSRDKQVLKNFCSTEHIYEVGKLNEREALQLFSLHAFRKNHPIKGYLELSMDMITYCQGIPLALTVLGCNLCQQGIEEWKSELEKLKNIPNKTIQKVLRTSYDSLERHEKNIFLDIACFFRGQWKDNIERILEVRNFCPKRGISRLIDKSLITIIFNNQLGMHDLLQQMGKEIVHEECEQPGSRSRLWNSEEIYDVLTTDTVTDKVQGILLDLHEIEYMELSSKIFEKMPFMRFLSFYDSSNYWKPEYEKIFLPDGLECLPNQLRYLHWAYYPLKSLPQKFNPRNLVELHMPNSKLEELWDEDINKALGNLKVMDLSNSKRLIRIPDLSTVLSIEILSLCGCENLVEIPSSLQRLESLKILSLEGCKNFVEMPSLQCLKSLKDLRLGGCSNLKQCPELPCSIKCLDLYKTAIEQLPSSIGHCFELDELNLSRCMKLASLPQSIFNLTSLVNLDISYCLNLNGLPENVGDSFSINQLRELEYFCCRGCASLTKMPALTGFSFLRELYLNDSGILEIRVGSLMLLGHLHLSNCKKLRHILGLPSLLIQLDASNCASLESASGLRLLEASDCTSLFSGCELKFFNCNKLNGKIVEDVLARHLDKKDVRLCVPGSEVSQQIKHKNKSGSSVSFRLNPHHFIIGFTFCAVFDPLVVNSCAIGCTADYIDESGHRNKVDYYKKWIPGFWSYSKHIFLWYTDSDFEERFIEASFQFYIEKGSFPERLYEGIIECGVHPIYRDGQEAEQENEDQSSFHLNLSQSYSDDCVGKDKKRSRNEEQNHQHDGKLKRAKSF